MGDEPRTSDGRRAQEPDREEEPLLAVDDVCSWLNVSRHWVYDEVEARRLPHLRLGRRSLRFRRADIHDYLMKRSFDERDRGRAQADEHSPAFEDLEPLN